MSNNEIIIRKAEPNDLKYLNQLRQIEVEECLPYTTVDGFWVADDGNEIVGMYLCSLNRYEYLKDTYIDCINHFISCFYVHRDHSHRGIGTKMFKYIYNNVEFYKKCARIEVLIQPSALKFWKNVIRDIDNTTLTNVCSRDNLCNYKGMDNSCNCNGINIYVNNFLPGTIHLCIVKYEK